jgi:hypothetical protein
MRFRCPHCKQRTISLWAKTKANGWWPSTCAQCGGKNVPATLGTLPAIFVFIAGLIAPFVIAGSATVTGAWLLLAAGIIGGAAASLGTYLLITPLLRHGTALAKWESRSYFVLVGLLVLLVALKPDAPPPTGQQVQNRGKPIFTLHHMNPEVPAEFRDRLTKTHIADFALREEYKAALEKARIPFSLEMEEGREYVRVRFEHLQAVKRVERELWGEPLPEGGAVHFSNPATAAEFKAWAAARGVQVRSHSYMRKEYLVWSGDNKLIREFRDSRKSDCPKAAAASPASC